MSGLRLFFIALIACLPAWATANEPLPVAVSVLPQKYLLERIGGRWVAVTTLVGSGRDPHTFEPTPKQVALLSRARVYVATGIGFETAWLPKLRRSNPALKIVDMRQGLPLRKQEPLLELDGASHGHAHSGSDPHVWTSPANLKQIARTLQRELQPLLPAAAHTELQQNLAALQRDIDATDARIRPLLARTQARRFMVFHPAWGYFADAYQLQQIPIEYEGKEPGPRTLAQIIALGKREQIRTVFVQPQFSARAAANIAGGLNARVEKLDDLAENILVNLESAAQAIAASR